MLGNGVAFTKNDALQAADHWKTAHSVCNSHPRLLCTSAFLISYSSRYSISHTNITAVLQTYFNLQEEGGETDEPLHQGEALQSQGHAHDPESLTAYLFPSGLPRKLAQYTPDYFLVVDSGATVHVLWVSICTAYTKESNSAIKWGGIDSHSVCTSIGHLNAVTYCKNNNNRWEMIILTSGCNDTWIIPNANRMLFSQVRAKLQGHKCILEGPNPGMLIAGTNDFIPFVTEEETGYCLLPMFPPPSYSTRHTGIYSNSMRVINMNSGNNPATALSFNPLVKRILLKRSIAKRLSAIRNDVRQNMRLVSKEAKRNQLAKKNIIAERRKIAEEKLLLKEKLNQRNYNAYHTACGHAHLKKTIAFKRQGKLIASKLPSKFLRDYQKNCAICLATKKRRKSTPKANSNFTEDLAPWEETYADSSGKFRTRSKRGNYYFTVFVDAKTGDKIVICHAKRKHFPVVYFTFINRIGRHPKVLYTDLAPEMSSDDFERYLLVKGVNHIPVPRGEHHGIGVAEKAIQDLSNMMRSYLTDSNLPGIYWDFVVEHAALVNSMITPSITDKSRTIFEHVWGVVPNLDLIPPIGCFAARLMDNSARTDWKLDPKNQSGVFLGFAHNRNVYGAQILVENSIITAKLQVAYDTELFPFHQRDNSNPRMQFLTWLLNRKIMPPISTISDSSSLAPLDSQSPYTPDKVTIDVSSDDEEVSNLMQDVQNLSRVPPFNVLDPGAKRSDTSLHVPEEADQDAESEQKPIASPKLRRTSRRARSSPSDSDSHSAKNVKKSKTTSKSTPARNIDETALRANKTLLIGERLKRYFAGYGGAIGTVTRYILEQDAYELQYSDGHVDIILFEDILALIPKSWAQRQQQQLAQALFSSVEEAALNAHLMNDHGHKNTKYTTPRDYYHAVDPKRTPDFREWIAALEKEYNLLAYHMGCWELFDLKDLPEDANLIGAKWVLKLKYKNGEYEKHKARIVALGYQQRQDIDFFATFSPTASYVTIRLVMALTALPHWYSVDLDATGAFISAPLPPEEQVFLKGIPGYPLPEGKCLKLKKTIYGLKQAPINYFRLCKEVYAKCGLKQLESDECVFLKCAQNIKGQPPLTAEAILESGAFHTMTIVPIDQRVYASCVYPVACLIIVMYVDNNGIRHNCHELLTAFESDVAADGRIDLHREGDMSSFLSVRYLNNIQTGEITADQESYIDNLLDQYNMTNCNPNKVPLKTSVNFDEIISRLPKTPNRELVSLYCKLIGELMFVAINTQPLIAHSVNALARFMSNANHELYTLAKGVLRYLAGHKARKITWCAQRVKYPFHPCELYAYADSSWADVVPSRKSSQCYLVFCNNAVFSWKATLASVLAMSTAEAELIALCACAADVAYCRKIANELGFLQLRPTVIHEDNLGAKAIAENGNFKGRSKHFELRWRFLHHYILRGVVTIKAIKRDLQLADIGTAPRPHPQLHSMGRVVHGEC